MKKISIFLICLCFIFSSPVFVSAANEVDTIDIEAVLYEDGSMYVTQIWEGNFEEGTEIYIPLNAPEYLTIDDLKVSDAGGTYETLTQWDIDKSFEEKAYKCGVNYTDTGYEICFGISEYGHNCYVIEYCLSNVIGSYIDADGVNFRFVNDEMNTTPTDVRVEIRLADGTPITDEIADIWAFGYDGMVEFTDGAILAYTESPIYSKNHVTVMFAFEKGIMNPARQEADSFESVKQMAFEDSDYDSSDYDDDDYGSMTEDDEEITFADVIVVLLGMTGFIGIPVVLVIFLFRSFKKGRKKKLDQFVEKNGYFRDIPNEGNVNATYVLGRQFEVCGDGSILAVGLLRLIDLGCLMVVTEEKNGFMGKMKESVSLQLLGSRHAKMNEYDEYLYTVLEGAAGVDGILQEKELKNFADQNDRLLRDYVNKCDQAGKNNLNQKNCLKQWNTPSKLTSLTPSGEKELGELLGFKKYLEDFSLIAERSINEMAVWKELLSYAMLFGIADKVAEQMKELYPEIAVEVSTYTRSLSTAYSCHYIMIYNMHQAEQRREQQRRSAGSGGFASAGGGMGSFGGSSGGGTR